MKNPHDLQDFLFYGAPADEAELAVILLHGRRQSVRDTLALFQQMNLPNAVCVMPAAHERTWYLRSFTAPVSANQPMLEHSLECVDAAVRRLMSKGFARAQIVFMGFSQGACLAAHYIYQHPQRWGGLVALSGGLFGPVDTPVPVFSARLNGMPVLLGTSDSDSWIPLPRVQETADLFTRAGAVVDFRVYPGMEHETNVDEVSAARALFAAVAENLPSYA